MSQKYKVLRGFDVRLEPGVDEFRRVAEVGNIITLDDVPEWDAIPQSEIDAGVIELVEEWGHSSSDPIADARVGAGLDPAPPVHHGGTLNEGDE